MMVVALVVLESGLAGASGDDGDGVGGGAVAAAVLDSQNPRPYI